MELNLTVAPYSPITNLVLSLTVNVGFDQAWTTIWPIKTEKKNIYNLKKVFRQKPFIALSATSKIVLVYTLSTGPHSKVSKLLSLFFLQISK